MGKWFSSAGLDSVTFNLQSNSLDSHFFPCRLDGKQIKVPSVISINEMRAGRKINLHNSNNLGNITLSCPLFMASHDLLAFYLLIHFWPKETNPFLSIGYTCILGSGPKGGNDLKNTEEICLSVVPLP